MGDREQIGQGWAEKGGGERGKNAANRVRAKAEEAAMNLIAAGSQTTALMRNRRERER